jgi:hypothetical protein
MMGQHKSDPQLFNYAVNLEKPLATADNATIAPK